MCIQEPHLNGNQTMSTRKRPWGVIAGPIIFFGGLAIFLGVQKAEGIRDQVEDWSYQLEHSAQPVVMDLPVYVPLLVDGNWLGQLETIVVQRDRPRGIDSLRLVARISDDEDLKRLDGCALRLQISTGSLEALTQALRCVPDTKGLISFGYLNVENTDVRVPVLVRLDDLPCNDRRIHLGPCQRFHRNLQEEMRDLAEELQGSARELRAEARRIRNAVRVELRDKVRGIR